MMALGVEHVRFTSIRDIQCADRRLVHGATVMSTNKLVGNTAAFKQLSALLLLMGTFIAGLAGCQQVSQQRAPIPILMVCEHGSVKSLMAASLFNKASEQRGLPYHATARGVSPDPSVPAAIAAALADEGFDVSNFVPSKFSTNELIGAERVVLIGLDTNALDGRSSGSVESWLDVPAASVDYSAARTSLVQHIDALLDELESSRTR